MTPPSHFPPAIQYRQKGGRHSRLAVVFPKVYIIHISHSCTRIQTRSDYTTDISTHPLHVERPLTSQSPQGHSSFPSSSRSSSRTMHKHFRARSTATKSAQVTNPTQGLAQCHTAQSKDKQVCTILINHFVPFCQLDTLQARQVKTELWEEG